MWVSRYLVWFVASSVLGWLYESIYCTIQERKWDNRGFLYGPLCPIYGTGVVAMMLVWQQLLARGIDPGPLQVFAGAALGSAVLEYMTSWALERLFHARWWDYSDMPLNLNGRICLPATILFGLAGLLVTYVLYDPILKLTDAVPPDAIEALSLVLVALVSVDATLTVSALTQFAQVAASVSDRVNDHMDAFVASMESRGSVAAAQVRASSAGRTVGDAIESMRDAGAAAIGDLQAYTTKAAEIVERERERFAADVRTHELGRMSVLVRSAARRVRRLVPVEQPAEQPRREQLSELWSELTSRRGEG